MKFIIALTVVALVAFSNAASTSKRQNPLACNPSKDCVSSTDCALDGGEFSCRCSYLKCKDYGTEKCGGSCVTSAQCAQWADGDADCKCTWLLSCERHSRTLEPGYKTYAKLMAVLKLNKINERLAQATEMGEIAELMTYKETLEKNMAAQK